MFDCDKIKSLLVCDDAKKFSFIEARYSTQRQIVETILTHKTGANTGHAVIHSMPKPPKIRRRNGPTDPPTNGWTDGSDGRVSGLVDQEPNLWRSKAICLPHFCLFKNSENYPF